MGPTVACANQTAVLPSLNPLRARQSAGDIFLLHSFIVGRRLGAKRGELLHAYEQASEARVAVCILEILIELRPPSLVGVPVGQGGVWSAPLGGGYRVGELQCRVHAI